MWSIKWLQRYARGGTKGGTPYFLHVRWKLATDLFKWTQNQPMPSLRFLNRTLRDWLVTEVFHFHDQQNNMASWYNEKSNSSLSTK